MEEIKETLELLNNWWKEGVVSEELAKQYKRKAYSRLLGLLNYRQIIVLSGLRRVGKTTLLYQLIEELLKKHDPKHVLYFNFDKRVGEITKILDDYKDLTGKEWKKEKVFVFLDEIVKLDEWSDKIKLIYDAFPNIKFIISSSSSVGLEEQAIKTLGGRYFLTNVQPLSFVEYLELKGKNKFLETPNLWEKEIRKEVNSYLLRSFPETITFDSEILIKDYMRTTIIDKIIKSDLPEKFRNVNKGLLFSLLEIFYSEPGFHLDYDSISKKLGISKKTLIEHVFYLEFSYLLRKVKNFRPNVFTSSRKLQRSYPYWWSLGCCYTDNSDRIVENLVASMLDAKYYWRKNGKEIDFLKVDKKEIFPIEVKNKADLPKQDLNNMRYFIKTYKPKPGLIIYNGEEKEMVLEGKKIKLMPLWRWLLSV